MKSFLFFVWTFFELAFGGRHSLPLHAFGQLGGSTGPLRESFVVSGDNAAELFLVLNDVVFQHCLILTRLVFVDLVHLVEVIAVLNHLTALDHVRVIIVEQVELVLVLLAVKELVVLLGLVVDVLGVSFDATSAIVGMNLLGAICNARNARLVLPHDGVQADGLTLAGHHADVHDRTANLNDLCHARLQAEFVLNLNHSAEFAHIISNGELLTVE